MRCNDCGWPGQRVEDVRCSVCGAELERPWPRLPVEVPREPDRAPGWGGEDEPEQPDDAWPLAIERRLLQLRNGGSVEIGAVL